MATKIKKQKKTKSSKSKKSNVFSVHYLAIILAVVLFLEGALAGIATTSEINSGVALLDMSEGITEMTQSLSSVFQPMADVAVGVNNFYNLAATQMMVLIDSSNYFDLAFVYGTYDFYQIASQKTASLLDVSSFSSWPAQVSGAYITY